MAHAIWLVAGAGLMGWVFLLGLCVGVAGELRAGLELWSEITMKVVTLGRWNAPEEEAE